MKPLLSGDVRWKDERTYRLLARDSSATSFPLPLLELLSRARLLEDDEACWLSAEERSFCFSFCFAALTRALVRRTLDSEAAESDGSSVCVGFGLLLLVAAWDWVESI